MKKLYAVYRGEAFLDCGTASELAARFDTNLENVYSKVSKERKARSRGQSFSDNTLHWYSFDDGNDENIWLSYQKIPLGDSKTYVGIFGFYIDI